MSDRTRGTAALREGCLLEPGWPTDPEAVERLVRLEGRQFAAGDLLQGRRAARLAAGRLAQPVLRVRSSNA